VGRHIIVVKEHPRIKTLIFLLDSTMKTFENIKTCAGQFDYPCGAFSECIIPS
jgi:hypothetical protein